MARREVPARLRKVPQFILDGLRPQVDGDWSRVTVDEHGAVTVHNHPQVEEAKPARRTATRTPTTEAAAPRRAPVTPAVLVGRTIQPVVDRRPVIDRRRVVEREPVTPRAPVVRREPIPEFRPPSAPAPVDAPVREFRPTIVAPPAPSWIRIPGVNREGDWERVGIGRTSHELSKQLRRGLPEQVPVKVNVEVLAMDGVDVDAAIAVLHHPEQVKINEETAEKKYPVLTFHRGDITVILGFRIPREPFIMAAYFTGEALKEYQRSHGGAGGGGGARKGEGVPTHPRLLRRRLTEMGATVAVDHDPDPEKDGKTATVTYGGEVLGKIRMDRPNRFEVSQDWQRMQRKIAAIKNREGSRRGVV